jgi:hypothetical protein
MELATIMRRYLPQFKQNYGGSTTPNQWSALNAILGCRTEQYGEVLLSCKACLQPDRRFQSRGHRACNQCQNRHTTQWLKRQQNKLLPTDYFMVTFTLPYELRALALANQKTLYTLLFECAISTVKDFGRNEKGFSAELGITAVLHTHSRQLNFHPHVHLIVPGGGLNPQRKEWRKLKGKYLFNGNKLATVFRGRLLKAINDASLKTPRTPKKWVAQCKRVGRGLPALQYLSRYLYRGVISNNNIVNDDGKNVTFQYKDSDTGTMKTRSMKGEVFVALILQHTLPKGFRRARDYGFLHGNAKRTLRLVQWVLRVEIPPPQEKQRTTFICQHCKGPMAIMGVKQPGLTSG